MIRMLNFQRYFLKYLKKSLWIMLKHLYKEEFNCLKLGQSSIKKKLSLWKDFLKLDTTILSKSIFKIKHNKIHWEDIFTSSTTSIFSKPNRIFSLEALKFDYFYGSNYFFFNDVFNFFNFIQFFLYKIKLMEKIWFF